MEDSHTTFQNEPFQIALKIEEALFFNPFCLIFTNTANYENLFHQENNILFIKIQNRA